MLCTKEKKPRHFLINKLFMSFKTLNLCSWVVKSWTLIYYNNMLNLNQTLMFNIWLILLFMSFKTLNLFVYELLNLRPLISWAIKPWTFIFISCFILRPDFYELLNLEPLCSWAVKPSTFVSISCQPLDLCVHALLNLDLCVYEQLNHEPMC